MQALSYYLLYPVIYIIASGPFWLLYRISDFLYLIVFYVIGYRNTLVYNNLKNSFPEKSDEEIKKIRKDYYKYLCDLTMETLKTVTWKEAHVKCRVKMNNTELLNSYYDQGKKYYNSHGAFR